MRSRVVRWALGCCLLAALAGMMGCAVAARWLTKPWPASVSALPDDLLVEEWSCPYRWAEDAQDLTVRGWWIEGRADRPVVLLLHAWKEQRTKMLPRARFLLAEGYSVFLPDLPAHGESDGASVSFGLREGVAVRAIVDEIRTRRPGRPIAGLGVSLGGSALLMADIDPPLDAYVLESTFATLEGAVDARLRRVLGPIGPWFGPCLESGVQSLRGLRAQDVRPVDHIAGLDRPIFLVHGKQDRSTPYEDSQQLAAAAVCSVDSASVDSASVDSEAAHSTSTVTTWWVEGAGHRDLFKIEGEEYRVRLLAFLESAFRETGAFPEREAPPGSARGSR